MKPANDHFLSFVALYLLRYLQVFYLEFFLIPSYIFPDGLLHNFENLIHILFNSVLQLMKFSLIFFQILINFV